MNKKLKFSWGHIIAFLALIFISYVAFMGDFYKNGGDFKGSLIKVLIILTALLVTFIGAQIIKGTDVKFKRSIIIERFLICLTPIAFIVAIIPINHFWTIYNQKDQIEELFNNSISNSKEMLLNYDTYTEKRLSNYSKMLDDILLNKSTDRESYTKSGFNGVNDDIRKENYITTLQLQLLSQNSENLKTAATNWINEANQGASVWNAFLIGNIQQISEAITNWNATLVDYSKPILSNETLRSNEVAPFDSDKSSLELSTASLKSLTDIYKKSDGIGLMTIVLSPILFMMLLFPYFLQKRNTKANGLYFLLSTNNSKVKDISFRKHQKSKETETSKEETNKGPYGGTF